MRNYISHSLLYSLLMVFVLFTHPVPGSAGIEWQETGTENLPDKPIAVTLSKDGETAYILCTKGVIVYSVEDNNLIATIPVAEGYSQLTLAPDGEHLFLVHTEKKLLSKIALSWIHAIPLGNSPVIGDATAPVNVIAFLDYQCPYCSKVFPTLLKLVDTYPEKANLIVKHFPLRMHRFANQAAIAALAASRQGKYKEMSSALIENYRKLDDETIRQFAEQSGLNMEQFDKDINDSELKDIIPQDMKTGMKIKVRGVPAIFINGRAVKNRSLSAMKKIIDEELQKQP